MTEEDKKIFTCIVCPVSCRITVTDKGGNKLSVSGHSCKRGEKHAESEYTDPRRMITTTVKIKGSTQRRLPVISDSEIPKRCMEECLALLYGVTVTAPIRCGDIVVSDICGLGVNIMASRSIHKRI